VAGNLAKKDPKNEEFNFARESGRSKLHWPMRSGVPAERRKK
jgi:hypothetical protein